MPYLTEAEAADQPILGDLITQITSEEFNKLERNAAEIITREANIIEPENADDAPGWTKYPSALLIYDAIISSRPQPTEAEHSNAKRFYTRAHEIIRSWREAPGRIEAAIEDMKGMYE